MPAKDKLGRALNLGDVVYYPSFANDDDMFSEHFSYGQIRTIHAPDPRRPNLYTLGIVMFPATKDYHWLDTNYVPLNAIWNRKSNACYKINSISDRDFVRINYGI